MSVGLHVAPWVAGTIATDYFGPIGVVVRDGDYERGMNRMFDALEEKTEALGGNNVVGMDIEIDPYADPPQFRAHGTAAKLAEIK